MQVHLAVVAGQSAGQQFTVEVEPGRPVVIGRASSNQVAFPQERSVSSHHAEIRLEQSGLFLVDRNSTNGLYVDEQRVPHCPIRPGLVVRFGRRGPMVQFNTAGAGYAPAGGGHGGPPAAAYGQGDAGGAPYGGQGAFPPAQGGPPPGAYGQPAQAAPPCGECGAPLGGDAFQCMSCGRPLCGGHYDPNAGSCQACAMRR